MGLTTEKDMAVVSSGTYWDIYYVTGLYTDCLIKCMNMKFVDKYDDSLSFQEILLNPIKFDVSIHDRKSFSSKHIILSPVLRVIFSMFSPRHKY